MSAKIELAEKIEFLENVMEAFNQVAEEYGVLHNVEVESHMAQLKLVYREMGDLTKWLELSAQIELQKLTEEFYREFERCRQHALEHGEFDLDMVVEHWAKLSSIQQRLKTLQDQI